MAGAVSPEAIEAEILRLVAACGPGKSISPSDVAQALAPEKWQQHLSAIRKVAAKLAAAGRIEVLRKGKPIAPDAIHGVIRLRAASGAPAE